MSSKRSWLTLKHLTFTGPDADPADIEFSAGLSVLMGASNTGKSFSVKALDFLLGAARDLPDIVERKPYDRAWLALDLPQFGPATFMRAVAGGSFELRPGFVTAPPPEDANVRQLSGRHDHTNNDNISQLLLEEIGLAGREIAVDANGKKRSLSFRDLARFCIVDEAAIQSETSPACQDSTNLSLPNEAYFVFSSQVRMTAQLYRSWTKRPSKRQRPGKSKFSMT